MFPNLANSINLAKNSVMSLEDTHVTVSKMCYIRTCSCLQGPSDRCSQGNIFLIISHPYSTLNKVRKLISDHMLDPNPRSGHPVSNWISTSSQPQRVTSGQSNSTISKGTKQNASHAINLSAAQTSTTTLINSKATCFFASVD